MHWNHRVVRWTVDHGEDGVLAQGVETFFTIEEVHYNARDEIEGHTKDSGVMGEDLAGLRWMLAQMAKALEKPVVEAIRPWVEEEE